MGKIFQPILYLIFLWFKQVLVFILLITLQNLVSLHVVVVFIYLIYNCFGNNVLHKITLKVKKTKQVATVTVITEK